jgi:hypothetical protein
MYYYGEQLLMRDLCTKHFYTDLSAFVRFIFKKQAYFFNISQHTVEILGISTVCCGHCRLVTPFLALNAHLGRIYPSRCIAKPRFRL